MAGTPLSSRPAHTFRLTPGVVRRFAQLAGMTVIQALLLFIPAGRLDWAEGWIYIAFYVAFIALNAVLLLPKGTALIEERGRGGKLRGWDKVVMLFYTLGGFGALVVAGLDERHGWSPPFPMVLQAVALLLMAAGYGLFSWAMATNAYFSAVVRIQDDRGHQVCRSGPYRFVRHPGYIGVVVYALFLPVFFASLWTFIPGIVVAVSIVVRAALEDRTLRAELPGYQEYARDVRYRLLPGVW